ncbi:MarR family transcriptional regulator [Hahella sp. CCB-MM4]|uniref:MarR family winged helix-turn-helix transcriptional regulator n=1 Tax=Hahella sp. (strain CCB-MM4) TaxID=1926491 RepID=UPI000B9C4784|nr:MarR family transcriptional regulator [Hahella sp. CCB-MM4]OZG70560.1 MarR family transcriptional regulator [Hahella sp. CCB-MM4]
MKLQKDSLGFLVNDVARLLRRAYQSRLELSSLTHAEAKTLIYVARHEGVRQVELADLMDIQPITLARLIDRLEEEKAVERRKDPEDRRAYRLYLLPGAEPHLEAVKEVAAVIRENALKGLSEQEVEAFMETMRRIRSNLMQG